MAPVRRSRTCAPPPLGPAPSSRPFPVNSGRPAERSALEMTCQASSSAWRTCSGATSCATPSPAIWITRPVPRTAAPGAGKDRAGRITVRSAATSLTPPDGQAERRELLERPWYPRSMWWIRRAAATAGRPPPRPAPREPGPDVGQGDVGAAQLGHAPDHRRMHRVASWNRSTNISMRSRSTSPTFSACRRC